MYKNCSKFVMFMILIFSTSIIMPMRGRYIESVVNARCAKSLAKAAQVNNTATDPILSYPVPLRFQFQYDATTAAQQQKYDDNVKAGIKIQKDMAELKEQMKRNEIAKSQESKE